MAGPVVTAQASATCPHGGQVQAVTSNTRVLLAGAPAVTVADTYPVAGCVFMVVNKPQPCLSVRWLVVATRVRVAGQPVVIQGGSGLCLSAEQAPQGPPTIVTTQLKVVAQ
ncbi:hypothetical protein I6A84_12785 [Frankia sp. CNm7]|uniref:Uncharacterized protein n=1 Tax=Frankia nepalensis TaxID=1836974 RepID=A0A937RHL2_9ACTN|nr:hypothetical protein [Frankia nepalensis]MBL7501518.1 hypothetical protein [Frankia nepalensis]MBL7514231.1 hypothetical protein [Frankia nepalensis]MBL7518962.1 hypothetical protein [Frankia nepalensis]MBL7626528.1 hypothetical protein [Frankia nepalensis]